MLQFLSFLSIKGSAGAGEDQSLDLLWIVPLQGLEQGGVFRVYRQDPGAVIPGLLQRHPLAQHSFDGRAVVEELGVRMTTTNFSVRMDSDIKKQCEELYGELGVNLTTAINVFLRQSLRAGGFPFDVRLNQPNSKTISALLEAEKISKDPNVKHYSDVEEALRELKR